MVDEDSNVRDRILHAAVQALDEGGEGNIRVVAVAQAAGVTQGMVSYYFSSRANLVAEAQAARFMAALRADTGALGRAVEMSSTVSEFRDAIVPIVRLFLTDDRRAVRAARVSAFGAATAQPDLMATIAHAHREFLDGVEGVVIQGQKKGFFVSDLDPRSVASMLTGMAFGLFISDVDTGRPADDLMFPALFSAFDSMIVAE